MKKRTVFLTIAMALSAQSVFAQTADNGVYVGLEGAYAIAKSMDPPNGARKTSETTGVAALRALVGYEFNQNLAVELGYFATDDFKQSGVALSGGATYDEKINVKGVDLALLYKLTEFAPGLFLKAGATHTKLSASATDSIGLVSEESNASTSGTGYLFGLGYEFTVMPQVGARLSYTRYEKLGGESDNALNVFSAGVKYKF